MAKGKKTGGRKKGSLNKTTASVKEALSLAFANLGDVEALVNWARRNRTEFYKLWGRMLPQEVSGLNGGPILLRVEEEVIHADDSRNVNGEEANSHTPAAT